MSQSDEAPLAMPTLCCHSASALCRTTIASLDGAETRFYNPSLAVRTTEACLSVAAITSSRITSSRAAAAGLRGRSGLARSSAAQHRGPLPGAVPWLATAASMPFPRLWDDSRWPLTNRPGFGRVSSGPPARRLGANLLHVPEDYSRNLSLHPYLILSRELFVRKVPTHGCFNGRK